MHGSYCGDRILAWIQKMWHSIKSTCTYLSPGYPNTMKIDQKYQSAMGRWICHLRQGRWWRNHTCAIGKSKTGFGPYEIEGFATWDKGGWFIMFIGPHLLGGLHVTYPSYLSITFHVLVNICDCGVIFSTSVGRVNNNCTQSCEIMYL